MPDLTRENQLRKTGYLNVAGIDEAGRGPLAGPVMAAAVILPKRYRHKTLTDSKKLSPLQREKLYEEITNHPDIQWSCAFATVEEIDRINILQASWLAMRRAVEGLPVAADAALIDGSPVKGFPVFHQNVVKGDSLSLSIAAASVIAKVERDRVMEAHGGEFPVYGFEKHKGYGTGYHLSRLTEHGPCPIHRQTFAPVAQLTLPFGPVQ